MDMLSVLFHRSGSRKIGVLVPSVVISEKTVDTLEITEHPVETGAAISDHAYKMPTEITMQCGFASGGSLLDFADITSIGLNANDAYKQLLALQESRKLFDVVTPKRVYNNMLMRAIEVTTDVSSENVLMANLTLREVIITSTKVIQVALKEKTTTGNSTAPIQDSGIKTTKPANKSVIFKTTEPIWNFIKSH